MSFSIICEGNDISDYIISFERNLQICTGIGTLDFVVTKNVPISFTTWDTVILYENGNKKGVFNISTIIRESNTGNYLISCQDNSKKLTDYFITDYYEIDYYSTTKYWIEKFLTEAGVNYEINSTTQGSPLSENTSLGLNSAYDTIIYLLQLSGWYIYFDKNGKAVIGELRKSNSPTKIFNDEIINITKSINDSMLRNKAVVWGNSGIIYSTETDTEWNYDSLDKRAVVFANSGIRDYATAVELGDTILEEFSNITEVTTAEIAGYFNVDIGDIVRLNAKGINEKGLITTLNTSGSKNGFITIITINERCPRLFGFFSQIISDYVYIGTYGYGIKRKRFSESMWEDFSAGLTNLNIVDLSINNDTMACINNSGELFVKYITDSGWNKFTPGRLNQTIYHPAGEGFYHPFVENDYFFPYSGGRYISCIVDKTNDSIYALFTTSGYTWLTTIVSSGIYDHSLVVTSGENFYYVGWDVESSSSKPIISTTGLGYGSKNCVRNPVKDINYIKWAYYLAGAYWGTGGPQLIYSNINNLKTIIDGTKLNVSNYPPYGFSIDTDLLSDNQYLYSYSYTYNRYERWDYINDIRVYCNLTQFPNLESVGTLLKGYTSPDFAIACRASSNAMYFQKVQFSVGATNIGTVNYPVGGSIQVKTAPVPVILETPQGFFAIWYIVRYNTSTLLPIDCIGYSFDIENYTYNQFTIIPWFDPYYFVGLTENPAWYQDYCNNLIINDRVLFFPTVNPILTGTNKWVKYGVILSIGPYGGDYLDYSIPEGEHVYAAAIRPDAAIASSDGSFYAVIDQLPGHLTNVGFHRGNYKLDTPLSLINYGFDDGTVYGYSYPKAFRLCGNSYGTYRISQSGGIFKLPGDGQVGQLEDALYVYTPDGQEGSIYGPGASIDSYYNRIYYIRNGALKYYDLNNGTTGLLNSNAITPIFGNKFFGPNSSVYYIKTEDYSDEQNLFYDTSKVIVPTENYSLDERGYYYKNYIEIFESPYTPNLECSKDSPLLVFSRGNNYFYSSEITESGNFNFLRLDSVINDMRVLSVSGISHIGVAGSDIYAIPYNVNLSGTIGNSGITLITGSFNRMETTNYGSVSTPYIFGSTKENFFQRDIDSEVINDYSSGSYSNLITIIRVDDIV